MSEVRVGIKTNTVLSTDSFFFLLTNHVEGPSSLSTLYSEWNNPVFVRPPQVRKS